MDRDPRHILSRDRTKWNKDPQGAKYFYERTKENASIHIFCVCGKISQKPLISLMYFFSFLLATNITFKIPFIIIVKNWR